MNKNELSTTGTLTAVALIRSVINGDDEAYRALMPDNRTDALALISALTALIVVQLGWDRDDRGLELLAAITDSALNPDLP